MHHRATVDVVGIESERTRSTRQYVGSGAWDLASRVGWKTTGLLLLLYSLLLRLPALRADSPLHSDSPAFLQVVALLRGEWHSAIVPFRIEYPVYPYVTFLINHMVANWLLAAKLAAFLPSVLVPVLIFAATLIITPNRTAALCAGFLTASSPNLILIGAAPLYDSTFIFATALFLLVGFLFIRKPKWVYGIAMGLVLGLAWASRGLGLFLAPAFLAAVFVLPGVSPRRKSGLLLASIVVMLITASLIKLPAKRAAAHLAPDQTNCFKEVMADGIRYAGGSRDAIVYRLNDSATAFEVDESGICSMTWKQYASRYLKDQAKSFAVNFKRIILDDLVTILSPFLVLFVPITLGSARFVRRENLPDAVLLGATCISFLILVPAIQYQDRYLLPLLLPVAIVAGIGCAALLEEGKRGRWVLAILTLLALVAAIDGFRHTLARDESEANYRKASEWIVAHNGKDFDFAVFERHHGVYAYLKHGSVMLPVDEPSRVMRYAEHMHVRYLLAGPEERRHNPVFLSDPTLLTPMAEFGHGADAVQVFELTGGSKVQ